jgi:hypothetical protein
MVLKRPAGDTLCSRRAACCRAVAAPFQPYAAHACPSAACYFDRSACVPPSSPLLSWRVWYRVSRTAPMCPPAQALQVGRNTPSPAHSPLPPRLCCFLACAGFAQTTAGCTSAASLPPALAANLTGEINEALLPKADQTYTNSSTKGYVSFTTPAICYNGNWCAAVNAADAAGCCLTNRYMVHAHTSFLDAALPDDTRGPPASTIRPLHNPPASQVWIQRHP